MVRHDYRQEIGLDPAVKTVPWPYALAILTILSAGIAWFVITETKPRHPPRPSMDHAALVAHKPALPGAAGQGPAGVGSRPSRHGVT